VSSPRFPTAPAWYRPLLATELKALELVVPRIRRGQDVPEGLESNRTQHPSLGHWAAERLLPGEDAPAQHMSQHASRYAWALRFCEGRRVVDLGCGVGYGTMMLSWVAGSAQGFDLSTDAVAKARELYPGISYATLDLVSDPLPAAEIGVCFEVLEHLEDPQRALRKFLSSYGRVLFSFPNPIFGGSHLNPHHRVDWPLVQLKRELRAAGAKQVSVYRQGYFSSAVTRLRATPAVTWLIDASVEP
jgi:SAM-dependent methyltransferase